MVHKMQRMALSSHQLLGPAASGAEKADSENTRNSENNVDDPPGKEEEDHQGDWITHQHWSKLKRKQNKIGKHTQHTQTQKHTQKDGKAQTQGRKDTFCMNLCKYFCVDDDGTCRAHSQMQMHLPWTKSDTVLFKSCATTFCWLVWTEFFQQAYNAIAVSRQMKLLALNSSKTSR